MQETAAQITDWLAAGHQVAVATVLRVQGSAPRPVGAHLIIRDDGQFVGSVSGGCVENAVIMEAERVMADGRPRLLHFGISDEMSWEVGLACGGQIDVLLQQADPVLWQRTSQLAKQQTSCALLTIVSEAPGPLGAQRLLLRDEFPTGLPFPTRATLHALAHELEVWPAGASLLVEPLAPAPQIIVFGGVHIAVPLVALAHVLGFQVVITDPRTRFASRERFPDADQILPGWPREAYRHLRIDEQTAIVILTHDPKIDEPALAGALETDAFYIGAIGSRKTHRERFVRLAHLGVDRLQRVYGPVGLDLGGDTPEQTALAILAEIIAVRNGGSGRPLRDTPPDSSAAQ